MLRALLAIAALATSIGCRATAVDDATRPPGDEADWRPLEPLFVQATFHEVVCDSVYLRVTRAYGLKIWFQVDGKPGQSCGVRTADEPMPSPAEGVRISVRREPLNGVPGGSWTNVHVDVECGRFDGRDFRGAPKLVASSGRGMFQAFHFTRDGDGFFTFDQLPTALPHHGPWRLGEVKKAEPKVELWAEVVTAAAKR